MVSNRVQIPEERVETFVDRLSTSHGIEEQPGFRGIRVMSPVDAEGHVTMSFWDSFDDYENWRDSDAFEEAHEGRSAEEAFEAGNEIEIHRVVVERGPKNGENNCL
ncbi:MAG: antibiotic biosynthesis monooxygenase [Halobacteria archaeon]